MGAVRWWAVAFATVASVSCGAGGRDSASTTTLAEVEPALARTELAALDELGRLDVSALPPIGAAEAGHDLTERPPPTTAATRDEVAALAPALRAARNAAERFSVASRAISEGYLLGSPYAPGTGTHRVRYSLVDRPFDPAAPSMLLYDGDGPDARLVGLSYWITSPTPPEGFPGGEDVWHRHRGLCIERGLVRGEHLTSPDQCPRGVYLDGRNLWMLHVWVAPGVDNPWGLFASANPDLD